MDAENKPMVTRGQDRVERDKLGDWDWHIHTNMVSQMVKNPPADAGDTGLIPELGYLLEKGVATYSSMLAWEIPRAEEPGGLLSMGLQRVRYDWMNNTFTLFISKINN